MEGGTAVLSESRAVKEPGETLKAEAAVPKRDIVTRLSW
jgi:hypothetical protein